jgi:hypothetical protein
VRHIGGEVDEIPRSDVGQELQALTPRISLHPFTT